MRARTTRLRLAAALAVAAGTIAAGAVAATAVKPYAVPIGGEYTVRALFSVDDKVPHLGGPAGQEYRMVGIPDGLGAHPNGDGTSTLFMNHELNSNQLSEPAVGGPKNRGAFVSQWILDADGDPIAGRRAYDRVYDENTFVGPAPEVGNATRGLARFCSGFLAGPANGFDRWIYLTNEEEQTAANTFDGKGGVSVAIYDNELHTLPDLGRYAKENTVVQPHQGTRAVIFATEDGPPTLDNQLYMYVGKKHGRRTRLRSRGTASTAARCTSSARTTQPGTASGRSAPARSPATGSRFPTPARSRTSSSRRRATPGTR